MKNSPPDFPNGRGSQGFERGERVTQISALKIGDLLISDCRQFNSTNLVEITGLNHFPHQPGKICKGRWYGEESEFSLWHWEFEDGNYYRALRNGQPANVADNRVQDLKDEMAANDRRHEIASKNPLEISGTLFEGHAPKN